MGVLARGRALSARGRLAVFALTAVVASTVCVPAAADLLIPQNGKTLVNQGLIDLACTDLSVNGELNTGTGTVRKVFNITVGPTGLVSGNGVISYSGTLTNNGTIQPGVTLVVSSDCGLQPERPIPTLSNWMLVVLAGLLLGLAGAVLNGRGALRRRGNARGVTK
jgi:hypothetical protein